MYKTILLILGLLAGGLTRAQDTFSIIAIDTITGEMGSAGASCIGAPQIPQGCYILSDVLPGIGVIHTQASYHPSNQNYARSLMQQQIPPEEMIELLIANDIGGNPQVRQYGIADFYTGTMRVAGFTGTNCLDYKNHIIGPNYVIAGNILLGQQILDSMEARFLATEGELACKLMAAMQGANVVGADTRCLNQGVSSLSAFLRVARPEDEAGSFYLDINIPSTPAGIDPIDSLQAIIDEWGGCVVSGLGHAKAKPGFSIVAMANEIRILLPENAPETVSIEIYGLSGNLLIRNKVRKEKTFSFPHSLEPGIYLCRVAYNDYVITEKFAIP